MTPLSKAQELPIALQPVLTQSIADEEAILTPELSNNPLQTEEDFSVRSLTNNIPTAPAVVGTISAMDGTMSGNLSQDDGDNPSRNGSLSDDYQLVDLAVGQWVTLWLNSSDFDPYLQLINSETGEVITDDDDSGEGTNSRLRFLSLTEINYLVRVTSYDEQETGSYTLAASTDALPPVVGTLSAFQGTITGTLSAQDALNPTRSATFSDDYQLGDLTVGEPVILDLSSESFDTYLQLINADTQQVMTFDDDSGEGVNSRLSFTPFEGINYLVRVTSYRHQATGNYTLTAAPAPDLVVSGSVSPTAVGLGETLEVSWSVTNQGRGTASADWYDSIYLSSDASLDSSDTWLANTWATERLPLLPGTSYSLNRLLSVPNSSTVFNSRYLLFVADRNTNQSEVDETNNIRAVPITLKAPNLSLEAATAPTVASWSQTLAVSWQVANNGEAAARAQWTDYIYLSDDAIFDSSDLVLNAQQRNASAALTPQTNYTLTSNITIPSTRTGSRYLLFVADRNHQQGETDETDNVLALPIEIKAPNLVVSEVTAPSQAILSERISISWTVTNTGEGSASAVWSDYVYLSTDETLDGSDTLLTAGSRTLLAAGGSYTITKNEVKLPNRGEGSHYLLFVADGQRRQGETDEADNVHAVPIELKAPDLIVSAVSAPATAVWGQTINLAWTITNQGQVVAPGVWYDTVYFSDNATLDAADQYVYDSFEGGSFWSNLAAGDSYSRDRTLTVSRHWGSGERYLLFVTDDYEDGEYGQGETDENNNILAVPITLSDRGPNLHLTQATAPTEAVIGETVALSWTVVNSGGLIASASGHDEVYLSDDQMLDGADLLITSNPTTIPLAVGSSYTLTPELTLPNQGPGNRYLLFVADGKHKQVETNESDNLLALPIELKAPNLIVSAASASPSAFLGQTVEVAWTVTNSSAVRALFEWHDSVYLSDDETLDSGDTYLTRHRRGAEAFLEVEGSYTLASDMTIPNTTLGNRYLLFVADSNGSQGETNETDNIRAIPLELKALDVDLTVSEISTQVEALAGDEIEIIWTVTNLGSDAATGIWTDSIYLSDDAVVGGDQFFGSFSFSGTLAGGQSKERRQTISLPKTLSGEHWVIVKTDAGSQLIEYGQEGNNTTLAQPPITVIRPTFPNLQVSSVTAPPTAFSRQETVIEWTVTNTGQGATSAPVWYDRVWLSLDPTLDSNDLKLGQAANPSYLKAGDSYSNRLTVTLPQGIDGNYYFLVETDYTDQVLELESEGDNLGASRPTDVELTPPPDLQVTSVSAPSQAFSGQKMTLTWTVTNAGTGRTLETHWYDEIYLSTDTVWDGGDDFLGRQERNSLLNAQASYSVTREVTLPIGISGDFYVIVRTDAGNQVYEQVFESNNAGFDTTPTTVNLTPPPDLEVELINVPTEASASHLLTFNYRVTNAGSTVTPQAAWQDSFYLSADDQLNTLGDLLLKSFTHYGALAAEASYSNSVTLTLPDGLSGRYYLFAVTDNQNKVFELNNDNNIASSEAITLFSRPADLIVSAATAPATAEAGQAILVEWTLSNAGAGETALSHWTDRVFASRNNVIGDSDDILLASFSHEGRLNVEETYSRQELVTVPFNLVGDYHLFVVADANSQVYEAEKENNNYSELMPVTVVRQTPDLQVTQIAVAESAASGQSLTVNWTVQNLGIGKTNVDYWYDEVFLSADTDLGDSGDISLGRVYHSGILEPSAAYSASETFTLPIDVAGSFYVIVRSDSPDPQGNDRVIEGLSEDNNDRASAHPSTISLSPVSDLVVASVDAPNEAISGQSFDLSWTVSNAGADALGSWRDVFYLSRDQIFDRSTDTYLGFVEQTGGLAAGQSDTETASFSIPRGLSGRFYVFAVTDSSNSIYERNGESNNVAYERYSMQVILPSTADLMVSSLSLPTSGVSGQNATIEYTVTNLGTESVLGSWYDSIYLSADEQWDVNDSLLAQVLVAELVKGGHSYSRTVTAPLPGMLPGDYHVIIRSDIRNVIPESHEGNNIGTSLGLIAIETERLAIGIPDTNTLSQGQSIYYRIEAQAGQAIRLHLDSAVEGVNNELYVRYGQMPSRSQFDFISDPFTSDPERIFPIEQDGTYYVLVYGDSASTPANYTITAEDIPFSLQTIGPEKVGNAAPFTLELEGARFNSDTAFQIVDAGGNLISATRVVLKNSTTAYGTFNLSGKPVGDYNIRAVQTDGSTVILEGGLTVESGRGAELLSAIDGPDLVRRGTKNAAQLNYANIGDADEVAPLIILQSFDAPLGLSPDSVAPRTSLHLLGVGDDVGVDTLRPGETKSIPFFFSAPENSVKINTLRYTAYSSTPIGEDDWNLIETAIRPSELSEEEWKAFWSQIQPRIGRTWGDYVQLLNELAKAFSTTVEHPYDVQELFTQWYESGDLSIFTPKSVVSGQLLTANADQSAAEVTLQLYQRVNGLIAKYFQQTVTDQQGQFIFSALPPGTYEILIVSNDYVFANPSSSTEAQIKSTNNPYIVIFTVPQSENLTSLQLQIVPPSEPPPFNPINYGEEFSEFYNQLVSAFEEIAVEIENFSTQFKDLPAATTASESQLILTTQPLLEGFNPNVLTALAPQSSSVALSASATNNNESSGDIIKKPPSNGVDFIVSIGELGDLVLTPGMHSEQKNCEGAKVERKYGAKLKINLKDPNGGETALNVIGNGELTVSSDYKLVNEGKACFYELQKNKLTLSGSYGVQYSDPLAVLEWIFEQSGSELVEVVRAIRQGIETINQAGLAKFEGAIGIDIGLSGNLTLLPDGTVQGLTTLDITISGKSEISLLNLFSLEFLPKIKASFILGSLPPQGKITGALGIKGYIGNIDIATVLSADIGKLPDGIDDPQEIPLGGALFSLLTQQLSPGGPPDNCSCDDDDSTPPNSYNPPVVTSFDPNDILGPQGFGEANWITAAESLNYTIRFENDPKLATAPAQVVRIAQQLDSDLDFRTFRVGDFGFGDTFIDVPDNRAFYQTRLDLTAERGIYVDVVAGIDVATGEAFWEFTSIDPTTGEKPTNPLLGFLPPNLTSPEGDGFVSYSVRPKSTIATGDVIDAEATIVFDINEPIDTPAIFHTIDVDKPTSTVNSLLAIVDNPNFRVSWSGSDAPSGSALAGFSVYVSDNGGSFVPWLEKTTLTEAIYKGEPGHTYAFYSVAIDNASNVQVLPTVAQASTKVAGGNTPPVLVNPIGLSVATEDALFNFILPENIFNDTDAGDSLTYLATLANGNPLPSWLTFDEVTRTFSGTPSNNQVGTLNITVTASDHEGATVNDNLELTIENVNDAPTVDKEIANQTATEDTTFTFTIPDDTFNDVDTGDSLTYTATLDNGSALPSWLTFDTTTRTFNGMPTNTDVGAVSLKVTASDRALATIEATLTLTVENTNDAPTLTAEIANQSITENSPFNFTLPANTFSDIDVGDTLTYSATLADGRPLPTWLSFNAATGSFSGTPGNSDSGLFNIKVTASDTQGATADDIFALTVINLINGNSANNTLSGTANPDSINGFAGDDYLEGLAGDDSIDGSTGKLDRLFGGEGNDTLTDPDGVNGAHGGTGNDTLNVTFAATWDNDTNSTNAPRSDGKMTGGYGDDLITITMNNRRFFINLKGDEPTNSLLDGNDEITLLGSYQNSVVALGGGHDRFTGGIGSDNVSGGAGNDFLIGNGGSDILTGDAGNDTLMGGAGSDTLTGGLGQDQFVYTNLRESGDTLKGFQVGEDRIVLSELMVSLGYSGNNPLTDGYVRLVQGNRGTSVQVDPDGQLGSGIFSSFILLEGVSANTLSANSFVF